MHCIYIGEGERMVDETNLTSVYGFAAPSGETAWERVGRLRTLRALLDDEIKRTQVQAILDSRSAEISAEDLASMWKVTKALIYTLAPVKSR